MSTCHPTFLGLADLPYCKMLSFNSNPNVFQLPGQRKRLRLSDRALQIHVKFNYVNFTLPMEFPFLGENVLVVLLCQLLPS